MKDNRKKDRRKINKSIIALDRRCLERRADKKEAVSNSQQRQMKYLLVVALLCAAVNGRAEILPARRVAEKPRVIPVDGKIQIELTVGRHTDVNIITRETGKELREELDKVLEEKQ